jgi:hypothetical protein
LEDRALSSLRRQRFGTNEGQQYDRKQLCHTARLQRGLSRSSPGRRRFRVSCGVKTRRY